MKLGIEGIIRMSNNISIFILCEGTSEVAIIDILLDANKLVYNRDDIETYEPLHIRSAYEFESSYLNVQHERVKVYRILDSKKKENLDFKFS